MVFAKAKLTVANRNRVNKEIAGLIFDIMFPGLRVETAMQGAMEMFSYELQAGSAIVLMLILINALRLNYFSKNDIQVQSNSNIIFIDGMTCNHCVDMVTKTLNKLLNVKVLSVDLQSGKIELDCSEETISSIKSSIIDLGYKIRKDK